MIISSQFYLRESCLVLAAWLSKRHKRELLFSGASKFPQTLTPKKNISLEIDDPIQTRKNCGLSFHQRIFIIFIYKEVISSAQSVQPQHQDTDFSTNEQWEHINFWKLQGITQRVEYNSVFLMPDLVLQRCSQLLFSAAWLSNRHKREVRFDSPSFEIPAQFTFKENFFENHWPHKLTRWIYSSNF